MCIKPRIFCTKWLYYCELTVDFMMCYHKWRLHGENNFMECGFRTIGFGFVSVYGFSFLAPEISSEAALSRGPFRLQSEHCGTPGMGGTTADASFFHPTESEYVYYMPRREIFLNQMVCCVKVQLNWTLKCKLSKWKFSEVCAALFLIFVGTAV